MEKVSLAGEASAQFMFVKFSSGCGTLSTLPPAPPPSIIDDGDGMAHIAPDIVLDTNTLDASLKRLIDAVMRR